MRDTSCPDREVLSQYIVGRLSDEHSDRIALHFDDCEACQQALLATAEPSDTLVAALKSRIGDDPFSHEPERQEAMSRIIAIGHGPTIAGESNPATEESGSVGHYRLLEKLGEGGMGAVYKALHTKLDKVVALKVLPADRLQNSDAITRFEREMKAVGKLSHRNIVAAHDAGEVEGTHYLVMELVEGIDLSALIRGVGPAAQCRFRSVSGTSEAKAQAILVPLDERNCLHSGMSIADACELIRQAAIGLQHAHERGMVHRDIKPSNLMLARTEHGQPLVKVLDMGLALLDEQHAPQRHALTSTGQMMGTLDYMAPEQGADSHTVDIRADIYSLGATLYKLLCGESPFPASRYNTPIKLLTALATEPTPSIATKRDDLPVELVAIVNRMLAKRPNDRFATPADVAEALTPWAEDADLSALLTASNPGAISSPNVGQTTISTDDFLSRPSTGTEVTMDRDARTLEKPSSSSARKDVPLATHSQSWWTGRRNQILVAAAGLAGIILLGTLILLWQTKDGTIIVEIDDPDGLIEVAVVGEDIVITDKHKNGEPLKLRPGDHKLHVTRGDVQFETDNLVLKKGGRITVRVDLVPGQVRVTTAEGVQLGSKTIVSPSVVNGDAPTNTSGSDYALNFDGQMSYVELPSLTFTQPRSATVELRCRADGQDYAQMFASAGPGGISLFLSPDGKWWRAGTMAGGTWQTIQSDQPLRLGIDTHLAAVWDGAKLAFFVDGKLQKSAPATTRLKYVPSVTTVGMITDTTGSPVAESFFSGRIDEIRVSSVARYEKDFESPESGIKFNLDADTLALYHCDESAGETLHDASPNQHDGRMVGAKWVQLETVQRPVDYALDFDGTGAHVVLPRTPGFDDNKAQTLECYVVPRQGIGSIVSFGGEGGHGSIRLSTISGGANNVHWRAAIAGPKKTAAAETHATVEFNRRTHVAIVFRPGNIQFFLDGKIAATDRLEGEIRGEHIGLIGANQSPAGRIVTPFNGVIDEMRLSRTARYERDFTPESRFVPDSDTLALYHFDEGEREVLNDASPNQHHGRIVGAKWVKVGGEFGSDEPDRRAAEWVLSIGGSVRVNDESVDLKTAAQLPSEPFRLTWVALNYNPQMSDARLAEFKGCNNLNHLDLGGTRISDSGMSNFPNGRNLTYLSLGDTQVGNAGLARLKNCMNLRGLYLAGTSVSDPGLEHLNGLKTLVGIDLKQTNVTADGVAKFKAALQYCKITSDFTDEQIMAAMEKLKNRQE